MKTKISGFYLDEQQQAIVEDKSNHLLVVAGAGSGKTLTILGKINYLINNEKIKPNQIICISFTNAASTSLKNKIQKEFNLDVPVYTFHKLSLKILKYKYEIADSNTLEYIIDDFFESDLIDNEMIYKYLKIKKKEEYLKKLNSKEIKNLKKLLSTFIHLFKCNNKKLEDFNIILSKVKRFLNFNNQKEKTILVLALNIYLKYQNYLK